MSRDAERVYEGLSKVAHAIRRSTALYVAMNIVPQDATVADLKDQAEDLAKWLGGHAQQQEDDKPGREPLGEAWPPRD